VRVHLDEERDVRRQTLMGRRIFDITGERVGRVVETWPYDGGGEVEMAVVRMQRLGESRLVPVGTLRLREDDDLVTPYSRWQVEDSPALEEGRHALAAEERAVSYWSWEEPDLAGSLTRRWQRSSGYFATARRSPTNPSPTTTAS
jgi:sporulation protein YlmC with PRC-barrel domain